MINAQNQYMSQQLLNPEVPHSAVDIDPGPIGGIMSGPSGLQGAIGASQGNLYDGTSSAGAVAETMVGDRRGIVDDSQIQIPVIVDSDEASSNLETNSSGDSNIDPSDDESKIFQIVLHSAVLLT